jgi:hypothetical protein
LTSLDCSYTKNHQGDIIMSATITSRKELKALLARVEHVLDTIEPNVDDPDLADDVTSARKALENKEPTL